MQEFDYIIIGGGIAGTTAAETLRKSAPDSKIAILESEPYPLYSRVLIPSYLKNKIYREKLFLRKFSDYKSLNINLFSGVTVKSINFSGNKIYAVDLDRKENIFSYKKLLIASGGKPNELPPLVKGGRIRDISNSGGVLRMQTMDDADHIKETLENNAGASATVIGESFIALEFLEIFTANNLKVHAMIRGNYFSERKLGKAGAEILEENFKKNGITLHKNSGKFEADIIGSGIGIKRNLEVFQEIDKNIGIITNEFLQTSRADVFAAGDIAEYYDVVSERRRTAGNWTTAFLQGRTAALNMAAETADLMAPFRAVPSYGLGNFGYHLAFIGDTENAEEIREQVGKTKEEDKPTLLCLFLKDARIKGAIIINRYADKAILARLIEEKATYNEYQKVFA